MAEVIDLGEYRVERKPHRPFDGTCQHKHLTVDQNGGIITCDDCGKQIDAFIALNLMLDSYSKYWAKLNSKDKSLQEQAHRQLHLKAAQRVEDAWRGRKMIPVCPHCSEAIFPDDGFGSTLVNREIAVRRRQAKIEAQKRERGEQ
ncbi:hypothetical protein QYH69_34115 [Paraburkholderia sp. SARCC-3016]|uniref:hypothetical protein n=1 Tax=Paraburkholderia sp. SARCC-3016 TaxID=3058611 RepID=UPI0028084650|nr:hypothetical protein [Paraburkholderia sp. SARCC-3016]MDQ7982262.1 hypothetical protein [Paraburkholderia sp. SARCC-3016]